MICFLITGFTGHYPVGTCAVVYALNREQAKRVLAAELAKQRLGPQRPDDWTVEPLTPMPDAPCARVILNGDY